VSAIFETNGSVPRVAPRQRFSSLSLLCLAFPLTFDPAHESSRSVDSLIRAEGTTSRSSITDHKEQ
jgi:hypothetical protein